MHALKRTLPWRRVAAVLLYVALLAGGFALGHWFMAAASFDVRPGNEAQLNRMVITAVVAYTVSLALPFVPGAEIGWGLILLLGPRVVALVYGCTVLALLLSYGVGRRVAPSVLARAAAAVGLHRLQLLILETQALSPQARVDRLTARAPRRFDPFLLRHRHVALGLALNTPGNALLGGGGGLALAAGMSGLYRPLPFLLTVAVAVSPVPLFVWVAAALRA